MKLTYDEVLLSLTVMTAIHFITVWISGNWNKFNLPSMPWPDDVFERLLCVRCISNLTKSIAYKKLYEADVQTKFGLMYSTGAAGVCEECSRHKPELFKTKEAVTDVG